MSEREVTLPSWDIQGTGEANVKQIVILGVLPSAGLGTGLGARECPLQVLLRVVRDKAEATG